ncbi:hypothetical protein ACLOJK_039580 [Asimina triloba]
MHLDLMRMQRCHGDSPSPAAIAGGDGRCYCRRRWALLLPEGMLLSMDLGNPSMLLAVGSATIWVWVGRWSDDGEDSGSADLMLPWLPLTKRRTNFSTDRASMAVVTAKKMMGSPDFCCCLSEVVEMRHPRPLFCSNKTADDSEEEEMPLPASMAAADDEEDATAIAFMVMMLPIQCSSRKI